MRPHITILCFFLINACNTDIDRLQAGSWKVAYSEKNESPFTPCKIQFYNDSIKFIDGYSYCHSGSFTKQDELWEIKFSNGSVAIVSLEVPSDSTIKFNDHLYYKIADDEFPKTPDYELLGFHTGNTLGDIKNTSTIQLIKTNNGPKIILYDVVTDLEEIPSFLVIEDGTTPSLLLYIGKGISFENLLETYYWISMSGIKRVTLVLENKGFDQFFFQIDEISLSDSLISEFFHKNNMLPPPNAKGFIEDKAFKIIKANELKLDELNDSLSYLIKIDTKIDIIDYLKLKGAIEKKRNINAEIVQSTAIPKKSIRQ